MWNIIEYSIDNIDIFFLGGDTVKFGMQRLWGAAGWGVMSMISGGSIDWYSTGLAQKNHLPGYLLSAASFFIDFVVAFNLKVRMMYSAYNLTIK